MLLKSNEDDHTDAAQKFYLGQHGSIFSAACPGLVLSANNDTSHGFLLRLDTFRVGAKNLKWMFVNGTIESVLYTNMVIVKNTDNTLSLINKTGTVETNQISWERINTRLLGINETGWKQDWTVSLIASEYDGATLHDVFVNSEGGSSVCYKTNPAFSASFENFASNLVIRDPSDDDQCRQVREDLGFDENHPFDTEVVDKFMEHMCDPFFTGVDHVSDRVSFDPASSGLSGPPKFETVDYTPVEYELVEYGDEKEFVTIDYEQFTK
jgi:hypothetical protein